MLMILLPSMILDQYPYVILFTNLFIRGIVENLKPLLEKHISREELGSLNGIQIYDPIGMA